MAVLILKNFENLENLNIQIMLSCHWSYLLHCRMYFESCDWITNIRFDKKNNNLALMLFYHVQFVMLVTPRCHVWLCGLQVLGCWRSVVSGKKGNLKSTFHERCGSLDRQYFKAPQGENQIELLYGGTI